MRDNCSHSETLNLTKHTDSLLRKFHKSISLINQSCTTRANTNWKSSSSLLMKTWLFFNHRPSSAHPNRLWKSSINNSTERMPKTIISEQEINRFKKHKPVIISSSNNPSSISNKVRKLQIAEKQSFQTLISKPCTLSVRVYIHRKSHQKLRELNLIKRESLSDHLIQI